jgi:RNA polymerase sigma factor (sigma-70 family)
MASATLIVQHIRRLAAAPAVDGQPDRELLRRFTRDRDDQAFAALLRRHGPMVWGACRRVLPRPDDAEDVFQATFLLLTRKAAALRDHDSVGGWLYGVAYRLALRARSAEAVRADREGRTPPRAAPDPLADITLRETQQLFDDALARLPEKCRAVLVLCCLEGLTQDEAARQLGCSRSTLKRRLEEGRTRLRKQLVRHGLTLPAALLAATLAPRAGAALPPSLASAVLGAAAGGPVAERVANLAARSASGLLAGKFKVAAAVMLAVAVTVAGAAGIAALPTSASPVEEPGSPPSPPAAQADDKPRPRVDRFDDPLPDGAVARIGTTRFRHGDFIQSLAFAAEGKRLLSYGGDGIRVWDAATGREQRHLVDEPGTRFLMVAFSTDGKVVATTYTDESGIIKDTAFFTLWDVATGKKLKQLGNGMYCSVCFAPDGRLLAVARYDQVVETWDVAAGKQLASWAAHEGRNRAPSLAFTQDGKMLMTACADKAVCFWEPATGKKVRSISGVVNTYNSLAMSLDGKLIAAVEQKESPAGVIGGETASHRIRILDAADGKVMRQVELPAKKLPFGQVNAVRCLALSGDGKTLAGAGAENIVHLWDVGTGKELASITSFASFALTFSPDGKTLAVATWGHAVQLFDVATGKELPRGAGLHQPARSAGLTPDGKTIATPDGVSSIALWDTGTGELRRRLDGHEGLVTGVLLSADGRTLFSASADGTLRAWDVTTGRQLRRLTVDDGEAHPGLLLMARSPDSKLVVARPVAPHDSPLRLIDVATGRSIRQINPGNPVVHGAAFLPDGRSLVVWTGDRKARVWDVTTGKTVREVEYTEAVNPRSGPVPVPALGGGPQPSFFAAAVSPDGRLIAFGSQHDMIAVHELAGGAELWRVEKLARGVGCLAFSPDGRTLAWGSQVDPKIHLTEVATGKERQAFTGHRGGAVSLTFSADGKTLVSGGGDTTLLVWDLTGRARGGALSAAELDTLWQELLGDDAPRAYRAVRKFAASPASAIGLFRDRIKPVAPADEKRVANLVAELDSDDFAARQKAGAELEKLGDLAAGACRKALAGQPSAEARRQLTGLLEKQAAEARKPSAERVRVLRALEVLELSPTEEARQLLAALAKGAPGAWLTEEARLALARLTRRAPEEPLP